MSGENDLIKLYSGQILELAADIPRLGRLDAPDASVKKRSPLCGSTVTVDLTMADGKVSAYAQDVKACALGQAAASIVGGAIVGCSVEQISQARDALRNMLKKDGPTPDAPFEKLEVLRPAAAYKNRHASILLALDAASEAAHQAKEAQSA
ncbi:iron-sulfur cluster assembly scaffold protein [uncultured Pelagimonas sp.]|uniref:iron-sulfur cluster assembly scaffold protein n=1 Tax=uncultured Pelagimonas sp. TaxID=1618102 RepID=UPI0026189A64|nr:iron-sulfur cluster assembly scaffold protein [uncultured Pelagimonas sp.]